jgi:hypothetical protein
VVDAGAVIVEVLGTSGGSAATRDQLDAWIVTYEIPVTSVIDVSPLQTLNLLGIREATVVVELPSMRVAFYDDGDQTGLQTTAATMALDEVLRLLSMP